MNTRFWPIVVVTLALIVGAAAFLNYRRAHQKLGKPGVRVVSEPIYDEQGKVAATNSVGLPETVLDFTSKPEPLTKVVLDWLPKDTLFGQRHYAGSDGLQIALSVVLMGGDRTSIHKPQYCLQGTGWQIAGQTNVSIPVAEPHAYQLPVTRMNLVRTAALPNGETITLHGFYVYWFVADQQLTQNHAQRMWWMARDQIRTGVLQRWAYVACLVAFQPGQESAVWDRLTRFLSAAVPQFQITTGQPLGAGNSLARATDPHQ